MILSKKTIILIAIAVLIVATIISYPLVIKKTMANLAMNRLVNSYERYNINLVDTYKHVMDKQKIFDSAKTPTAEQYLSLAFSWKGLTDEVRNAILTKYNGQPNQEEMTKEENRVLSLLNRRALNIYEAAIKKFKKTNSIVYLNAGNAWRDLGHLENNSLADYEMAEKRYLQALELDAGDPNNHLLLIELYKKELQKPEAFIKARYDKASKTVLNQFPIAISFAAYVRELGQYEKALEFYQALYQAAPRPEFKRAIEEIKLEMQKSR